MTSTLKTLVLIFVAASLVAQVAPAGRPAPSFDSLFGYEIVKVGSGIYAFISRDARLGLVSGNSVAIVGEDGVVVVDAGQFPSLTKKMIAELRTVTPLPVRALVITHWHGDHNTGIGEYVKAFPGISIVSTEATRDRFLDRRHELLFSKFWDSNGDTIRKMVETGNGPGGKPLPPERLEYFKGVYAEAEAAYPTLKDAPELAPNVTFQDNLKIFLGRREVDVMFLGRANTAGDAVVYVPDAKVLMTGDLVVAPTPYGMGSFMTEWIETMDKLLAIDAETIVPGHGPVEHDKTYPRQVLELMKSVTAQAQAGAKAGLTLEQTQAKVDVSQMRPAFTHGDRKLERNFDEFFFKPAVKRAYREVKEGKLKDED
jgi:cyclase